MKKLTRTTLFAVAIGAMVTATSCKKDEKTEPTTTTTTSKKVLLAGTTSKSWEISKILMGGVDQTSEVEACNIDDILRFFNDGAYQEDEGTLKCHPEDPQIYSQGTWNFSSNETIINTIVDNEAQSNTILELTASTLKISFDDDGTNVEVHLTVK